MDEETLAEGSANQNADVEETTVDATVDTVAEKSSPATEPSKAAPTKPDLASILSDPEIRKQFLSHPDIAKEIEGQLQHRFSSERGRVRAEVKAEYDRIQAEEANRQERERLRGLDEVELGEEYRRKLDQEDEQSALQSKLQPLLQQRQLELLQQTGQEVFASTYALAKEAGATDEELDQLNPREYTSLGEYVKGAVKFLSTREGKKLAKDMAKTEAKAMLEERGRETREKSPGPENLPPADASQSDSDFTAMYATGKSNNTARQLQWMRQNGIL
jgi:hypothetical protein